MDVSARPAPRALGTMVAYGFERGSVHVDLDIAERLGAAVLEILPDWAVFPDPAEMGRIAGDRGFRIHSAHGCWGGQTIRADRVDLGSTDPATWAASVDDLKRCLDWLALAGGTHLVVHPGGLSAPEDTERRLEALRLGLRELCEHIGASSMVVCVENMPTGVYPGSRMGELSFLAADFEGDPVGLAIDTGHANIVASAAEETRHAGRWLRTTHVHDNDGRKDTHDPPGSGSVNWPEWSAALDEIGYRGPIMLECIRILRREPERIDVAFLERLALLTGGHRDE